jgi:uncharacterized protein YeaO (DUF488 family)
MPGKPTLSPPSRALAVKRIYAEPTASDGARILVDRLWPRGVAKAAAKIDLWLKDVAPSDRLRRQVHADKGAWQAFVAAYGRELEHEPAASAADRIMARLEREPVTLLYAARDELYNNAVVLKAWLEARRKHPRRRTGPPASSPPAAKAAASAGKSRAAKAAKPASPTKAARTARAAKR